MNKQERKFDACFKSKGGISRDKFSDAPFAKSLLVYARAQIELLRKNEKNVPAIYIDFIDNPALNATTERIGDQFFIGIYIGCILQPFSLFSRILACNSILTDIGNAALEDAPQKLHDIQLKDTIHPLLSYTRKIIPKDPIRKAAVSMFVKHILDFLIFHEYAHVAYGHVDYCNSISEQADISADRLTLHSLETSADTFSTFINMMFLFKAEPAENPIILKELRPYYKGNKALRMWLFSIYTYFRLFGHINLRQFVTSDSHPTPGCRADLVLEAIHTYKDYMLGSINDEILVKQCLDVIFEVEEAFAQISEQGLDTRPLRSLFSDETVSHTNDLYAKEIEILDLLRGYSYIPRYK